MYPSDKRKARASQPIDNRRLEFPRTLSRLSQNTVPLMEPGRMASAVQVRNFKALLEAAGSIDDLALALDMPLQRINQLLRGENFVRETVHHIEETLKLPSGFLDHLDAQVMPDQFARLKESLRSQASNEDALIATVRTSSLASMTHHPPEDEAHTSRPTPAAVDSSNPALPRPCVVLPTPNAEGTAGHVMTHPYPMPRHVSYPSNHLPHDVLEIRRLNLAMLTEAPGAKGKLAHLMGMSPANVSHRIHKNKKLDDAETRRLTNTLHLPPNWFDTLRAASDVPDDTKALLTRETKSRRNGAKVMYDVTADPEAQTLLRQRAASDEQPESSSSTPVPSSALESDYAAQPPSHLGLGFKTAGRMGSQHATVLAAAPIEGLTIRGQVAVTTTASTVLLSLGEDDGMGPIARALLHTVFLKARAGDLDEVTALRLLQEVVALESSQVSQAA